jgi:hypothetical protein
MSTRCEQELCPNWAGDAACPCDLFDLPKPESHPEDEGSEEVGGRPMSAENTPALDAEAIKRVRDLHRETFVSGIEFACQEGECDHPQCHDGGESPECEFRVCAHCLSLAEQTGVTDDWYPGWVMYPCATITALDYPTVVAAERLYRDGSESDHGE